ncbi:MAG TPA: heavy metal translocating P-type ATPase, partial [Clostridia bacterium]|nr:heavy metal translocating P-type ATPase [Clostridia bacterium]
MNDNKEMTHLHFKIDQLGCASCAVRIEEALGDLSGIESVRLDFATANLKVSLDRPHDQDRLKERIQSVIQSIEQDASLVDSQVADQVLARSGMASGLTLKPILRLLSGTILLVTPWLFPLPDLWSKALWLLAYLLLGLDVLWMAVRNLARRQWFDEHFLMGLATLGALAIGDFAEAVTVMLFYQTGEYLQDLAVGHSRHSVRALLAIQPDQALRLNPDGTTQEVLPSQLAVGEHMLIRPGDRVALDSRILSGRSELDTAALTGESRLRPVDTGDDILAGSINGGGVLT